MDNEWQASKNEWNPLISYLTSSIYIDFTILGTKQTAIDCQIDSERYFDLERMF